MSITSLQEKVTAEFRTLIDSHVIAFDVPMTHHTSFGIGGPAEVFVTPGSISQLLDIIRYALINNIQYFILGKGSNILVSDYGIAGLVISTASLTKISHDKNFVSAYCGASLRAVSEYSQGLGLAGMEFAHGIPGSVGGAVYMNAGAYGGEIANVLYCSKYVSAHLESLDHGDPVRHLKAPEHHFSYRRSVFQDSDFVHLSSVFKLRFDSSEAIASRMMDLEQQRLAKQPMDLPSGGSVFKRPEGYFTGKLVDDCGLRGYRIGDAAISDKHCGFIVNLGSATAQQVRELISYVQDAVHDRFGVHLEPELRFIGRQ